MNKLVWREIIGTLTTLLIFALLGPPIGAITFMTLVLFTSSSLDFSYSRLLPWEVSRNFLFVAPFMMMFSYIFAPLALICGAVAGIARLNLRRPGIQVLAVTLSGFATGLFGLFILIDKYRIFCIQGGRVDFVLTCVVPAFCCGWFTRRNTSHRGHAINAQNNASMKSADRDG